MPSTSRAQQRLMGMVHAYQTGQLKGAPAKVREVAQRIDPQAAQDFATTTHKGLPEKAAGLSPSAIAGLAAATTAALPLAGELIGFAHAPRGYRAEGTGRGFLQGAGAGVGAATGGLLGLAAGPALTAALGEHISPETAWLLTVNSPLVGAVGGGALGANIVQQRLGRPRWEEALNRLAVYRADRQLHPHEKNSAAPAGNPLILAGRPSAPKLTPSGPNAATQINTAAASGPGIGGAATADAAAAQLPQAQAAAGLVQTVPSNRLAAVPPAGPPTGFQPNAQGQVVYPAGQGPVTGQVAPAQKLSFMAHKANQPLRQSGAGEGELSSLQIKPSRVEGLAVFDQFSQKRALDYSQLYTAVGEDPYLRAFITKCAAAGYSGPQVCQAAQDCSRVSDLAARTFAPLCKLAGPWGFIGKLAPKLKGLAPKLFRGGEEAALGAEQAAPRFLWNAPAGAGAGVEAAAGREAAGVGAGLLASMRSAPSAAAAPRNYWQVAKDIGGPAAWQAGRRLGLGAAGYVAGGTADLGAYGLTGQDPGLRGVGWYTGLMGRRGVAGYGAGYVADTAAQGLGLGDPRLRNVGAVAGGLSNFAGPLAQVPGLTGQAAGATERFMGGLTGEGMGALAHGGRVLGRVPYAADRATRLGQLTGTYAERAGLGAAGYEALQHADARGFRRGTSQSAAIQTNPQRAAELDMATEKNHPGYLAQKQEQIAHLTQNHPQVVEAVRTGNPAAIVPAIPGLMKDPKTAPQATAQLIPAVEEVLQAKASQPGLAGIEGQMELKAFREARPRFEKTLSQGIPGYQPGNPAATAAAQADPASQAHAQAHQGALDTLWNWFQGLDGKTQLLLGAGLLAAVGGLFTERPGMALGGLALAGLAPAFDTSDPYGVRGYLQGQPPAPPAQDPAVPPPAAQPPLAAPAPPATGVSAFHPHQALPSVG